MFVFVNLFTQTMGSGANLEQGFRSGTPTLDHPKRVLAVTWAADVGRVSPLSLSVSNGLSTRRQYRLVDNPIAPA